MANQDLINEYPKIYPEVHPSAPELYEDYTGGSSFRLHKINSALGKLESEEEHYSHVRKKYARARSVFQKTAVIAGTLSAVLTASGIGTTLTGPGVIVGVPLSAVGGILGLLSAWCGVVTKRLSKKISKHEKTIQLAKSKANTINDLVSKALSDDVIDEREFELIMRECEKYSKLKSAIRQKSNKNVIEKQPSIDLGKLKSDLRDELRDELRMEVKKDLVSQLVDQKN